MITISLDTVARLLGQTKRHIRRRIAEGSLVKVNYLDAHGRTHIPFEAIRTNIGYTLTAEDISAILEADAGDPLAQHEVAMFFLESGDPERAMDWLHVSAQHGCADSMLMLGECYLEGLVISPDWQMGIDWMERAANAGMMLAAETIGSLKQQLKSIDDAGGHCSETLIVNTLSHSYRS